MHQDLWLAYRMLRGQFKIKMILQVYRFFDEAHATRRDVRVTRLIIT